MPGLMAAGLMIVALPLTDEAGFAVAALFFILHWRRCRGANARASAPA